MQRISSTNARPDVNGIGKHGFHNNEDLPGQDATYLTPTWLNAIQEELSNLLELHSIQLDPNDNAQLYGLLATDADLLALSEAVENSLTQLRNLLATKTSLDQAINYVMSNIQQHKDATNPHPQYLLASTFGVHLKMNAFLTTSTIDEHKVLGWNGEDGIYDYVIGSNWKWGKSGYGTLTFKPFRAYGTFLLNCVLDDIYVLHITARYFNSSGVKTHEELIINHNSAVRAATLKSLITIENGGYVELGWGLRISTSHMGQATIGLFVEDRVKRFSPVGYTSVVDFSNFTQDDSAEVLEDYSIYPNYEWFYYVSSNNQYLELNHLATFESPVMSIPHYHRNLLAANTDLYITIAVGKQTVELPTTDYVEVQIQVLRGATDTAGNIVIEIPLSMRSIDRPNNEKLVYTIAYYTSEPDITNGVPSGSIDGNHLLYVLP